MGLSRWNWVAIICIVFICLMIFCPGFSTIISMGSPLAKCIIMATLIVLLVVAVMMDPSLIENLMDTADDAANHLIGWFDKSVSSVMTNTGNFLNNVTTPLLIGGAVLIGYFALGGRNEN